MAHSRPDELARVAPIAHPGQICADELSCIAQALKTCADELPSNSSSRENMCSSCSSRSSTVSYARKELARATVSSVRGVNICAFGSYYYPHRTVIILRDTIINNSLKRSSFSVSDVTDSTIFILGCSPNYCSRV